MTKRLRIVLPALLILLWFAGAGIGGPYFGKVSEVSSNDQTLYLPESADASRVQQLVGEFSDANAIPAVVVFTGEAPLSGEQIKQLDDAYSLFLGLTG